MKTLTKPAGIGLACLISVIAWVSNAADERETENYALRKRVETLESRLKTIEGRLAKLETWHAPSDAISSARPMAKAPLLNERHGTIWKEGEVNGWPYYVIPVGGASQPSFER